MSTASRRAVLKSIGLLGLTGIAASAPGGRALLRRDEQARAQATFPSRWGGQPLGRIANAYQPARSAPDSNAPERTRLWQDEVVRVRRVVSGETVYANSDVWLETAHGYLYASFVQPMWHHSPNAPQADLGAGRWARLTAPFSDSYRQPDPADEDGFVSRLRYGGVVRVTSLETGGDGQPWYHVKELYQSFYVQAAHLRLISPGALAPLSPEVDPRDKRLEVNLSAQTLTAFERDVPVFSHLVSSGIPEHATPDGVHYVLDKRISDRMVGGIDQDKYNLPGVPFVCYFTWDWAATHGCYWHNDWGRQRSHGCLNLPANAALWLWRWTTPYPDLDAMYERPRHRFDGTQVVVHY